MAEERTSISSESMTRPFQYSSIQPSTAPPLTTGWRASDSVSVSTQSACMASSAKVASAPGSVCSVAHAERSSSVRRKPPHRSYHASVLKASTPYSVTNTGSPPPATFAYSSKR